MQSTTGTMRVQFQIAEEIQKRLGVHARLTNQRPSKAAEEILSAWLIRHGKGRECFPDADERESPES